MASMASDRSRREKGVLLQPDSGVRGWPAITYESLPWNAQYENHATSRGERRKHHGPYQAAIPPQILGVRLELPAELITELGEASTELARFDELMGGEI